MVRTFVPHNGIEYGDYSYTTLNLSWKCTIGSFKRTRLLHVAIRILSLRKGSARQRPLIFVTLSILIVPKHWRFHDRSTFFSSRSYVGTFRGMMNLPFGQSDFGHQAFLVPRLRRLGFLHEAGKRVRASQFRLQHMLVRHQNRGIHILQANSAKTCRHCCSFLAPCREDVGTRAELLSLLHQ